MLGIILWVVFGVVIGAIAKMIMPGKENMGWLMTSALGIVGSIVGGFIAGEAIFVEAAQFIFRFEQHDIMTETRQAVRHRQTRRTGTHHRDCLPT